MGISDIKWNPKAFREARIQEAIRRELEKRAQRIAGASGDGFEVDSGITGGRGRARAAVYPTTAKAAKRNASENTILRNLDAGKG